MNNNRHVLDFTCTNVSIQHRQKQVIREVSLQKSITGRIFGFNISRISFQSYDHDIVQTIIVSIHFDSNDKLKEGL